MTTLNSLLGLGSFRAAVKSLLSLDPLRDQELRETLGVEDVSSDLSPEGPSTADWQQAVRAYSAIYEIAVRETPEEVLSDIRHALPETSESQFERLEHLLELDSFATEKLEGSRQRDAFLPILGIAKFSLDLRYIDVESGQKLVPIVTARMQFDEHVNGSDSVVFQIPVRAIGEIGRRLAALEDRVRDLGDVIEGVPVPNWSRVVSD